MLDVRRGNQEHRDVLQGEEGGWGELSFVNGRDELVVLSRWAERVAFFPQSRRMLFTLWFGLELASSVSDMTTLVFGVSELSSLCLWDVEGERRAGRRCSRRHLSPPRVLQL